LNAIDDVLDTAGRSDIRLYKESRVQALSCLRSRGGGHRGTAQCKAACNRFPYSLRATGHKNALAFELIAKNGKWIAVCHGPSKRNDGSSHALAASKLGNSAITIPLDRMPLETLKTTLLDEDLDLVTREGCPNPVPVNLQLRLTQGYSYVYTSSRRSFPVFSWSRFTCGRHSRRWFLPLATQHHPRQEIRPRARCPRVGRRGPTMYSRLSAS